MPGYLVQRCVRSGAQSKSPVSVKVTDAGPYKGVSLSDNYYTTIEQEDSISMNIRKAKLKDYGITPGRAAELKEMVKDKQYYSLVLEACNRANDFLASHLVKSFTENVGYRQIFKNSDLCELPCTENDFYCYKRKALHEFDLLLKQAE